MRTLTEHPNAIVDTLRLSERELVECLNALAARERTQQPSVASRASRGQPRASMRVNREAAVSRRARSGDASDLPRMLVHICHQRGHCVTYLVKIRDIHSHGVVFLHGGFVHEGATCAVLLRASDGSPAQLPATILRCRHVSGRVHELVAVFDRPVPMSDYRFADGSPLPDVSSADLPNYAQHDAGLI